jgi:cell division protein FtsZ
MSINLKAPAITEMKPRITVFGVGGAGGNAVTNMINAQLEGVDFVVANTDAQALAQSQAQRKIQMGTAITEGLGAGARPEIGCAAAEESLSEILGHLDGSHMVFITAGMGGGTGTGAAPVIARASREQGILTVGVVTKPFHFEGARRMRIAEAGIEELQQYVDTLIIIPNQNLFRVANEKTTFAQAFAMADQVLHSGVRGITDLMVMPGLINLDFADVRTVMNEMGKAMMGTGEADGEERALTAAEAAINNPLLDEVSMKGARGVLINITGGMDMTLFEVDEAANRIRSEVDPDANIIVGSTFDERLEGRMRVSVVATGIEAEAATLNRPERIAVAKPAIRGDKAPLKVVADNGPETAAEPREGKGGWRPPAPAVSAEDLAPEEELAGEDEAPLVLDDAIEPVEPPALDDEPVRQPLVERGSRAQAARKPGLLGRMLGNKAKPAPAESAEEGRAPRAAARRRAAAETRQRPPAPTKTANPVPGGRDLFEADIEEGELDIPAFLRRQAN